MDELAKLINDYSLNKHFADEMFVYKVCNILINHITNIINCQYIQQNILF